MVIGKDLLYFAFINKDSIVDCIPLAEIVQIKKMGTEPVPEGSNQRKHTSFSNEADFNLSAHDFIRSIKLDTDPDGYNSGRSYYVQFKTDEEFERLFFKLTTFTKDAIKRFEARSCLERSQRSFRILHNSAPFQYTAAAFVMAVGPSHPTPRRRARPARALIRASPEACWRCGAREALETLAVCLALSPLKREREPPQNFIVNIVEAQYANYLDGHPGSTLGRWRLRPPVARTWSND